MHIKNIAAGAAIIGGVVAAGALIAHGVEQKREAAERRNAPISAATLATRLLDQYDRDGVAGARDGAISLRNPTGVPGDAESLRTVSYVGFGVAHRAEYSVAGLAGVADEAGDGDGRADHGELSAAIAGYDTASPRGLDGGERLALSRNFADGSALEGPGSLPGERLLRWGTAEQMRG